MAKFIEVTPVNSDLPHSVQHSTPKLFINPAWISNVGVWDQPETGKPVCVIQLAHSRAFFPENDTKPIQDDCWWWVEESYDVVKALIRGATG